MQKFSADIQIIGINPYVSVPDKVLNSIFKQAGTDKGKIPIHGTVNGKPYKQTLVRFRGAWRLYINTKMLKNSPKRITEIVKLTIEFDSSDRTIQPHTKLTKALLKNKKAKAIFDNLRPSLQQEIVRYISFLKTEESIDRNIRKAINFLVGKDRFIGRDKP